MRKVNADDKQQAAELIELDGGELRREPLDTRKATFGVAAESRPRPDLRLNERACCSGMRAPSDHEH